MPGPYADLAVDLDRLGFLPDMPRSAQWADRLDRVRRLLRLKVGFEARRAPAAPAIAVVTGGTNVGKSAVTNALLGETVGRSTPLARGTKWPTVSVHRDERDALLGASPLEGYPCEPLTDPEQPTRARERPVAFVHAHAVDALRGLVLIDSPDVDSDYAANHRVADDLILASDIVVFITTPEKYNDDACMKKLRAAARLGKHLIVVLNKCTPEEGAILREDLTRVCAAALGDRGDGDAPWAWTGSPAPAGARAEPEVIVVPPVRGASDPQKLAGKVRPLLDGLSDRGARGRARESSRAGAVAALAGGLRALVGRAEEEALELSRLTDALGEAETAAFHHFRDALDQLDFHELDRVYKRILDELRIPVIDDLYDGINAVARSVWGGLGKLAGGGLREETSEAAPSGKFRAEHARRASKARRAEREQAREAFRVAERVVADAPKRLSAAYAPLAERWLPPPPGPEDQERAVEACLDRAEELADRWVESESKRQIDRLRKSPALRETLRALRGAIRLGPAALTAYLTAGGSLGVWDTLVGAPAAEIAGRKLFDLSGDKLYFQRRKAEHLTDRAGVVGEGVRGLLIEPVRKAVPTAVDADRLVRLRGAARALEDAGELPPASPGGSER